MTDAPTWIVMIRDVSHAIRIADQPQVVASLILDADTGLVRGVSAAETSRAACGQAMQIALTKPTGPLPPRPPGHVLYRDGHAPEVRDELARLLPDATAPEFVEIPPIDEAEDVFDSFVGHMAGRQQPDEPPTADDWRALYAQTADFYRTRPWDRWSDEDHLDLIVKVDGAAARYVAVIMGQAGIQRGLMVYPGGVLHDDVTDWVPGLDRPKLPTGALLLWLDPPEEVPAEFTAKASRYGWPGEADLKPLPLAVAADGPADLGQRGMHQLTLALAAVLAHDRHRTASDQPATKTTGTLALTDDHRGSYTIG